MTRVRIDLFSSLDGYTSAGGDAQNPMGEDWASLTAAYVATRTMKERVFGDTSGAGTTGVDDAYAAAFFEGVGAEIMGAAMFGLHAFLTIRTGRAGGARTPRSAARSTC